MDELDRGPRHLDPDVHQHEVHRAFDHLQRLAQVALAKVDEVGEAGLGEVAARGSGLSRLVLDADDGPVAVGPHRVGQIKRRDAVGRADLDDPFGPDGAADLVAELGLGGLQGHQLVGQVAVGFLVETVPGELAPLATLGEPGAGLGLLALALSLQPVDQRLQLGVGDDAHAWRSSSNCMTAQTAPSVLAMKTCWPTPSMWNGSLSTSPPAPRMAAAEALMSSTPNVTERPGSERPPATVWRPCS